MKRSLFMAFISLFVLSACQKNIGTNEINGSWRLTEVLDKTTNTASHPAFGSSMDIVISFLSANNFAGHTLRNTLSDGTYERTGNDIIFKNFSMTKIAEDQWGQSFLSVLNACSLQSAVPCAPSKITIQGNTIRISTPLRYDITLQKL
jgi:hypothetical protein